MRTCERCGGLVNRPAVRGRRPRYCSVRCRTDAATDVRRETRRFEAIKGEFASMGETEVRDRMASDPDFAEVLVELVERYMGDADGRERREVAPEVWSLLAHGGYEVTAEGHDTPLPSNSDIDYAELTGDWTPMVIDALTSDGMNWARANGFVPDLSEFGGLEVTDRVRLAETQVWATRTYTLAQTPDSSIPHFPEEDFEG